MKNAGGPIGDLLKDFFDQGFLEEAKNASDFFHCWPDALKSVNLSRAADHSRLADLRREVVIIEADHPGWVQLLQTRQEALLGFLQKFCASKDITVNGISFRLAKSGLSQHDRPAATDQSPDERPAPPPPDSEAPIKTDLSPDDRLNAPVSDDEFAAIKKRFEEGIEKRFGVKADSL